MALAIKEMGGDISGAQTGIFFVGLIYVLIAGLVKAIGTKWIDAPITTRGYWAYDYRYRSWSCQFGSYFCRFCGGW